MEKIFRIGARSSPLALIQADEAIEVIVRACGDFRHKIVPFRTRGDGDRSTPVSDMEGTDFFTDEIDDALLMGAIDIAVHSAKDLPDVPVAGLVVAAITPSIDNSDVIVSKNGMKLADFPAGAKVGTSSSRRKEQLALYRPDIEIVDIRGSIGERLALLDETGLDAILVAAAGLIRLALEERIGERLPYEVMTPHPLQGSLAVMTREGDEETERMIKRAFKDRNVCHNEGE